MSRTFSKSIAVLGVLLLAGACAQQGQQAESTPPASEPAPMVEEETMSEGMDMAMAMTPEKVQELAKMAAAMEASPEGVAAMLTEHGMTQESWDAAMAQIAADPSLQSMFDQAKAAAATGGQMMEEAGH